MGRPILCALALGVSMFFSTHSFASESDRLLDLSQVDQIDINGAAPQSSPGNNKTRNRIQKRLKASQTRPRIKRTKQRRTRR